MALNRDFVGREFPATEPFVVGREHVRDFARAIGDPNPLYTDPHAAQAAGYRDVVAPPTFLTVLQFRRPTTALTDPALGLDYGRVVHGEQRFELSRPLCAGEEIVSVSRVSDIRDAGRNELMTVETEVATTGGERIGKAVSTIVSRGTAASKSGAYRAAPPGEKV